MFKRKIKIIQLFISRIFLIIKTTKGAENNVMDITTNYRDGEKRILSVCRFFFLFGMEKNLTFSHVKNVLLNLINFV